jgi:hypothetical protein
MFAKRVGVTSSHASRWENEREPIDDGRLWPVSCAEELTDNGSRITVVDAGAYAGYAPGPSLFCLQ